MLGTRRFLPLFLTQSLGAFNDNVFKNALVILITYRLAQQAGLDSQLMVTAAAGIFILPFFLFSATAGQLADKYDKARLIRVVKVTEVILMAGTALGFYLGNVTYLMVMLFLMGTQSTFFGPVKYAILPDHLHRDELIGGNGLIEGATFLAILLGTMVGGVFILKEGGVAIISFCILAVAVAGWVASLYIPPTGAAKPDLVVNPNFVTETWKIIRYSAGHRDIFLAILAISWFWLVGATFLAQVPTFGKDVLGGNEDVVTLLLLVFSIGIGIGSLLCNRMLKGAVNATYVPFGALGITVFAVDLYFASRHALPGAGGQLVGVAGFLESVHGWRILADILLLAIAGGIYVVPLNAIVQERSDEEHRSRNIAAVNILNSLFMVISAVGTAAMLAAGFTVPEVFLTIGVINAGVAFYITRLLPGALARAFVAWLLEILYRVEVQGLKHYREAGDKVLIVANHQSYLDPVLIAAYIPDDLTFAVNTYISRNRLVRFFLSMAKTFPLDPANPLSTRALIRSIQDQERVVLFPEGRITVTGALMKVYEGAGLIADKAGATILPVRIDGAQYSPFSHLKGKVGIRLFPKIRLTFMPPRSFEVPEELTGRTRRQYAGQKLNDLMTDMVFRSSPYRQPLFRSLIDAVKTHGRGHRVLEDVERKPLAYGKLLVGCFVLGRALARDTRPGERVGILLPNTNATAISFFALQSRGRVPAMLNFSTGLRNLLSSCEAAQVETVYSSRRFVEMGRLETLVAGMEKAGIRIHYLEDLRDRIGAWSKLGGLVASRFPRIAYRLGAGRVEADTPAVVLFPSGTEGTPKGVVLSHENIQANRYQVSSCVDFGPSDIVFNALPLFHSFGLTCGTMLPLLSGVKVFLYPSPLHYRIVPELVYDSNATIMFGTDTFLAGYARFANPYDFYSIRYVFAGAEKLKDNTRQAWSDRFGIRIFEGYGATETAPVLSLNTPMQNRRGSVGRLLPAIGHRLEQLPGIETGGKLWVSGPNVMLGYLRAEAPGRLQPPEGGWYDTGDVVELDADGFVFIRGRVKRFAKIGGEMVSLGQVEEMAARVWPGFGHVVVTLPDRKKGEQLVLLTENAKATREELGSFARAEGIAALMVPAVVLHVDKLPLLGSGKIDFTAARQLAGERLG
ncbi:MAG TPA: acyl-[ACP]--phospholipid O-acyltransferase [Sedimenticola sp.]|nr:acyl-[ACP]--phospholipid O-acyltransferase [Sedimenticola sp.]